MSKLVKYVGTKLIEAREMNLGDYNKYKGWAIPENKDPSTKGYLVKYSDDYESWSPKGPFDEAYKKINGTITDLEHGLITKDNTYIVHDEKTFNAPHNYMIRGKDNTLLCGIHFQEGPIKEHGLNGVFHEDLIAIVLDRLESFQKSKYSCKENSMAIKCLEDCLIWLRKRTNDRQARNVQGTSEV